MTTHWEEDEEWEFEMDGKEDKAGDGVRCASAHKVEEAHDKQNHKFRQRAAEMVVFVIAASRGPVRRGIQFKCEGMCVGGWRG